MKEENFEEVLLSELYDVESRRMTEDLYLQLKTQKAEIRELNKSINYPDAKKHQIVSFIKSGIRIAGYGLLAVDQLVACAIVLILSEVVGIYEELV